MMWTRHQLAPAVPMQKVVDRAVAGRMTDGFLVSRLEIMDVQHFAGAGRFGKTRQQRLFFGHRHVLVLASTIWPGLERLDTTVVIGHVSAVHRTQRHAHRSRNRRLRHPALTQQHHLDALALRRRHLPSQRSLQPPYLGLAAFDHPFPRIRWSKRITPQARNTARPGSLLHYPSRTDSRRYGAGITSRTRHLKEEFMSLPSLSRRHFFGGAASIAAAVTAPRTVFAQAPAAAPEPVPSGPFAIPPLTYPTNAFEPHIDAKTME